MVQKKAHRFEEAWQRQAMGETMDETLASLIETARKVEQVGGEVPPAPYRLAPGRQRFLTEAAKLRSSATQRKERLEKMRVMRMASAVVVFVMVAGLVLGVGSAAAASVPGEPLYSLKVGAENVRMALAVSPVSRAEASLDRVEKRVSEFTDLAKVDYVDEVVQARVQEALQTALNKTGQIEEGDRQKMLVKLDEALQRHERTMFKAGQEAAPGPQAQLQNMVQLMARVRQELHTGAWQGEDVGDRILKRIRDSQPVVVEPELPEGEEEVVTDDEVSPAASEKGGAGNVDATGPKGGTGDDTEVPGAQYQPGDNPADVPGPGEPPAEPGNFGPGPEAPPQATPVDPGAYGPGPGPTPKVVPGVYGPGPGQQVQPAQPASPKPASPKPASPGTGTGPAAAPTVAPSPEPQQGTGQGGAATPKKP